MSKLQALNKMLYRVIRMCRARQVFVLTPRYVRAPLPVRNQTLYRAICLLTKQIQGIDAFHLALHGDQIDRPSFASQLRMQRGREGLDLANRNSLRIGTTSQLN